MSEFFNEGEKVRVDFEDGCWIDIKEEMTQADQDYIMNAMAAVQNTAVSFNLGRLALLERCVLGWSFREPITKDNLSNLRRKYREVVLQRIDEQNSKPLEYIRKN